MLYLYIVGFSFEISDIFALETNHLQFWVIRKPSLMYVSHINNLEGGRGNRVWKGILGIRAKMRFENRENDKYIDGIRDLIWPPPGKLDSSKYEHGMQDLSSCHTRALSSHWGTIFFWGPTYILHLLAFVEIRLLINLLRRKTGFVILVKNVRDAWFSRKRSGNAGSRHPFRPWGKRGPSGLESRSQDQT